MIDVNVFNKMPLVLEEDQNQTDSKVFYIAKSRGYSMCLTSTEAVLVLRKQNSEVAKQKNQDNKDIESDVIKMKIKGENLVQL